LSAATAQRSYRYYDLVMAAFVTVLLCSNIIGAGKLWTFGGQVFTAGVLFFPISYIFNDVLTEVYGYARARKVVWAGFAALIFASVMSWVVVALPAPSGWEGQRAYAEIFGQTPRVVFASLVGFFVGELANSFVLAKMKVRMAGRHLWMRTIGSTIVGEAIDTAVFLPLAFYGIWPTEQLLAVMFSNYVCKVGWEAVNTPITYKIVGFLKRAEQEDYFDRDTDFTPFSLKT
jgi:queuosine precursor transporter